LGRENVIRELVGKLKPGLVGEFDNAAAAYRASLAGTNSQTNAGIALRNVIEHYKGEIMNMARRHPKDQKVSWPQMAECFVGNVGVARQRFTQQETVWCDLQQRLSGLAKGRILLNQSELRTLYTEFIDHLYIVLSLVHFDWTGCSML
jgi:hypothetical protein